MCNNCFKESNIEEHIEKYLEEYESKRLILEKLLRAKSYKYSDIIDKEDRKSYLCLNDSCGIYHFFYEENNIKYSLYLGKASFGNCDKWNLHERLKQHFQPSQDNTIHGKIKKRLRLADNNEAINIIKERNVYLQFIEIYIKQENMNWNEIYNKIATYEKFCIEVLNPTFTDK